MKHQLYIVAFYWPPAGGPGVQRWLKFIKYLDKNVYEIYLVIPKNPDYASTDTSLIEEIPKGINTITVPLKEPSRWLKKLFKGKTSKLQRGFIEKKPDLLERFLLWVRGNYFIPDARVSWAHNVVGLLENHSAFMNLGNDAVNIVHGLHKKAETIITTGPPHSVHLIGMMLKEKTKFKDLKWIADFRDPWTTIGYHKDLRLSKASAQKHLQLESVVLNTANHIIVTSPSTKAEFQTKTRQPVTVITNGYHLDLNTIEQPKGKFTISHIGTLLADRNPQVLWTALSQLCKEYSDFKKDLELQLAGNVSESIKASIEQSGLSHCTNYLGYIDHDRAVALMYRSQVLLLIEIDISETKAILPGKTFEYLASKRPIIALGPVGSDIKGLIENAQAGIFYTYKTQRLKEDILNLYKNYLNGDLKGNTNDVSQYHREQLTQQLQQVIQS